MTDYEYIDIRVKTLLDGLGDLRGDLAKTKAEVIKMKLELDDHIRRGHWTEADISHIMERER